MNCPPVRDIDHDRRLAIKYDRLEGLKALLKMHEAADAPDLLYLQGLRRRLRLTENQLRNMRP